MGPRKRLFAVASLGGSSEKRCCHTSTRAPHTCACVHESHSRVACLPAPFRLDQPASRTHQALRVSMTIRVNLFDIIRIFHYPVSSMRTPALAKNMHACTGAYTHPRAFIALANIDGRYAACVCMRESRMGLKYCTGQLSPYTQPPSTVALGSIFPEPR